MALQDLVKKVEISTREEIEKLEKESSLKKEEIDKRFEKEIGNIEKETEEEIADLKEKELERVQKEAKHKFEMKILLEKNRMLTESLERLKEELKNSSIEEKKEIIRKEFETIKPFIGEGVVIHIPKGKKEMTSLLKEIGASEMEIIEKDLPFEDGFLIKGEDFFVEISLEKIIDEILQENKEHFTKELF